MLEHFGTDDRVVLVSIRAGIERIADRKQVRAAGSLRRIADRLRTEVETLIGTVVLLQNQFRQEPAVAPDFENRTAAVVADVVDDLRKSASYRVRVVATSSSACMRS
jgi:hypothetical protein